MKRAVQQTLFFLLVTPLLLCLSVPRAQAAAGGVPYGAEGSTVNTMNASQVGLIWSVSGICDENDDVPAAPADIDYITGQSANVMTALYYGGKKCPTSISFQHSALAGISNVVYALYANPPASTATFAMDLGQTLGFVPRHVEAQGIGFSGLRVILPIWKAFRNVSYALLTIILMIIGFMVMFRKKIDPKTVVTVQNAIPRVILALLLVTFSYAIVGVLIDLMYFMIVLAVNLIVPEVNNVQGAGQYPFGFVFSAITSGINFWHWVWKPVLGPISIPVLDPQANQVTPITMTNAILNGGFKSFLGMFFSSGPAIIDDMGQFFSGGTVAGKVYWATGLGVLGFLMGGTKGLVVGLASGPTILFLLVLVALLFGVVRLTFLLFDSYLNIIISLIFSPIQLMLVAIPGSNSFSSWLRWLVAKLIVFPITAVLLMVSALLTSQANANRLWAPPLLSTGGGTFGLPGFIGLGMLLVIPNIIGSIQKAMKAEAFIPGGVGAVFGPLGAGAGQLFQLSYQYSFISSAIRHKPDARSPVQTIRDASQKGFSAVTGGGSEGH